MQAMKYIQ